MKEHQVKKRIIAALFSLALALGLVSAVPAPASAASGSACAWDYEGLVRTCVSLTWIRSGIVVTSVGHSTPSGCGKLESSGGKYEYKAMDTSNGSYYWPTLGCSSSHGVYDGCGSCTTRQVKVHVRRRVHLSTDSGTTFTFFLRSNGTYSVSSSLYY